MLPITAIQNFDSLPPIAQEQVIAFIDFLKNRYATKSPDFFIDSLMAMPNVGKDSDFERVQNESTSDVFT